MKKQILAVSFLVLVTACGGSGGGVIQEPGPGGSGSVYLDRFTAYGPRTGRIAGADSIGIDALAASGSATYEGEAAFYDTVIDPTGNLGGVPEQPTLIGLLSLTTTFSGSDTGTYTAVASDFVDQNDVVKTGELVVTNGSLVGIEGSLIGFEDSTIGSGIISGTLSGPGAGNGTYRAQSTLLISSGGVTGGGGNGVADDFEGEGDDFTLLFSGE